MTTGTVLMGIAAVIGLAWSVGSIACVMFSIACRRRRPDRRRTRVLTSDQV